MTEQWKFDLTENKKRKKLNYEFSSLFNEISFSDS